MGMDLAELLVARREDILHRWMRAVRGTLHPEAMPRLQLVDRLPAFLDEVAGALRRRSPHETSPTAAEHGVRRLELGFDLGSVVREYGALHDAILNVAHDEGTTIAVEDERNLFTCVVTAIADAVTQYARQRDAEQQRLANEHFAFIAHELRNPLQSAYTALAALQSRDALRDLRAVQVLERGLTRMNELIETTLRIAQTSAGVTLRRGPVKLSALLEDAEWTASSSAEEKGIRLLFHVEVDQETDLDARLVRSALTNLVQNAVKYTRRGGTVEVRARTTPERLTIEVEDRCGGLPAGSVEEAFSPFAQMSADRSGFGLGLAITKQAADAHGGAIRVQNLPGKGCIFILELPIAAQEC